MSQYQFKLKVSPANVSEGGVITLKTVFTDGQNVIPLDLTSYDFNSLSAEYKLEVKEGAEVIESSGNKTAEWTLSTSGWIKGIYTAKCELIISNKEIAKEIINGGIRAKIKEYLEKLGKNDPNIEIVGLEKDQDRYRFSDTTDFSVAGSNVQAAVTMRRTEAFPTDDQALWVAIRNRTIASDFKRYDQFIRLLFNDSNHAALESAFQIRNKLAATSLGDSNINFSFQGPYAYDILKLATQVFLTLQCGVVIKGDEIFDENLERIRLGDPTASKESLSHRLQQYLKLDNSAVLPYLHRIVDAMLRTDPSNNDEVLPYYHGILKHRMTKPSMLELIWSYWQEEGMLVQTMNAVAFRFQNMRSSAQDPLGELEIDPLRPLNNLMWGFIQDEHNRLTVPRRAYEYDHHYGLKLLGKAVPNLMSADSRSRFIEAFHNLLYRTAIFYKEDAETTVIADAFPLLNALREVHLLLAEGAHNQFGDLPWTARTEMLMTQWLLARPEMREFLRGRHMVPYQEPWMGAVDCMKKLQGWTDTTVTHFHELAVTGERIILSVRYGDWSDINNIEDMAKNWARYWKADIQRYIHGYMSVTGVDLMAEVTNTREASQRSLQPSALLRNRLITQQKGQGRIPVMTREVNTIASEVSGYIESPAIGRNRLLRYQADE